MADTHVLMTLDQKSLDALTTIADEIRMLKSVLRDLAKTMADRDRAP